MIKNGTNNGSSKHYGTDVGVYLSIFWFTIQRQCGGKDVNLNSVTVSMNIEILEEDKNIWDYF